MGSLGFPVPPFSPFWLWWGFGPPRQASGVGAGLSPYCSLLSIRCFEFVGVSFPRNWNFGIAIYIDDVIQSICELGYTGFSSHYNRIYNIQGSNRITPWGMQLRGRGGTPSPLRNCEELWRDSHSSRGSKGLNFIEVVLKPK